MVANADIGGLDVQDMMLETVESHLGGARSLQPVEMLELQRINLHGPRGHRSPNRYRLRIQ